MSTEATGVPEDVPAGAARSGAPGDCQAVRNQLAICMAFHPSADEKDKQLAMCKGDLDLCRNRPTLPDCYDFIDFAPIYDRELGEADPSPETLERAKHLTADDCLRVLTWGDRARRQYQSCLKGETPPGFKDRYGRLGDRPFVKACSADGMRTEMYNAWIRREEDRVREMGGIVRRSFRFAEDGGLVDWAGGE